MEDWQSRLEKKIDRLEEAVVQLARMEERMVTLFNRMDKYDEEKDRLENRIDDLENTSTKRGTVFDAVGKGFWIVVTAVVSSIFWIFRSH
jgi:predicted  nucleic acid-binding Zn-ribbon protein